jgi:hypothetical protein
MRRVARPSIGAAPMLSKLDIGQRQFAVQRGRATLYSNALRQLSQCDSIGLVMGKFGESGQCD